MTGDLFATEAAATTAARFEGPKPVAEYWIARRLGLPLNWDGGVTSADDRREAVRRHIVENTMQCAIAGKRKGLPCETWSEFFERVYEQPLEPRHEPKKHASRR